MNRTLLFFVGLVASLLPWVSAPIALVAGIAVALLGATPAPAKVKQAQTWLLQLAIVGLGAGMDLVIVGRVGLAGLGYTAIGILGTLALAGGLRRVFRVDGETATLLGVGTAICGGSAIAAAGPAIGAKANTMSVALAIVFLLNAAALLLFPALGHALTLSPSAFGMWSALAIHDTSSVVGAAMAYSPQALAIATTVKLARALWILPVTLALGWLWRRRGHATAGKAKFPWFILGFIAMAGMCTWIPALAPYEGYVLLAARRILVVALFLVGAGVSRAALRNVGYRPLLLGLALWLTVGTLTLAALQAGIIRAPM